MPLCSPQRYVANNGNVLLAAALSPSSVMPVENQVLEVPVGRTGTGAVVLEGSYTGAESALYEIEIVDGDAAHPVVTSPIATGAGSGKLENIEAYGAPQTFTVELGSEGVPELRAGVAFEGVRIVARNPGAGGNVYSIEIDRSGLVFTPSTYSLLNDLPVGSGGATNGLKGPEYDWDSKVLSGDNIIPADAHRVAFGEDTTNIYLAYKQYADGEWGYHFVPAIRQAVSAGTVVKFVTGSRTAIVNDGDSPAPETFPGIVTVYDLLNAIKSQSSLLDVVGIVAYDRSPTGQAARELLLRTDAHAELSSGAGSKYATGFADVTVAAVAPTELVTAECIAVSTADHPLARVGVERWKLKGSVSGELGEIVTGVPYLHPQQTFGLTVPRKLPNNYGQPVGRFSLVDITYVPRDDELKPPICPVAMKLGSEASDQTITLEWTKRPSGDCLCDNMPVPRISKRCLGIGESENEGESLSYQADTNAALLDLYDWYAEVVRDHSYYRTDGGGVQRHFIVEPNESLADGFTAEALKDIVASFEATLATIDPLDITDPLRIAGVAAWGDAVAELKADVADLVDGTTGLAASTLTGKAAEALSANDAVVHYHDGTEHKVRKAVNVTGAVGFVTAGYSLGDPVTVMRSGVVSGQSALTFGYSYAPKNDGSGDWVVISDPTAMAGAGVSATPISATELLVSVAIVALSLTEVLLSERYDARMNVVLISAGISPLGKSDASIIESGDGCWRDLGGDYWTVIGSGGAYAPAFNNAVYYSSTLAGDGKRYYSTKEFAFQINIKCPGLLEYGDRITMVIGGAGTASTYQLGDLLKLPIIAGQDLHLAGGQDGNSILVWYVSGTVAGALPNFTFNPVAPGSYVATGVLEFDYTPGGIPNKKGDKFTFALEGGHFRWRKNGGAWEEDSSLPAIDTAAQPFDSGLTVRFLPGASPSYDVGDTYTFRALQPWAASNLKTPGEEKWRWSGTGASVVADCGFVVDIRNVTLAQHTLPTGATITLEGGTAPGVYLWTETLTRREGVMFAELATPRTARYLRLTIGSAPDAAIGWLHVGAAATTALSADVQIRPSYRIEAGATSMDQGGRYLARGTSGEISFSEIALADPDVVTLLGMVDWAKRNNDEPIVLVPNAERPDEAYLMQWGVDEFDFREITGNNAHPDARDRRYSIDIPMTGVWRA